MDRAYQVINWKSVFLIAGMLPMGIALAKSGAATNLGDWMISVSGPFTPMVLLVGLVVLTLLFPKS